MKGHTLLSNMFNSLSRPSLSLSRPTPASRLFSTTRPALRTKDLDGILVVSIDQAVAAPLCATRLADMGARVIKVERPEGDFARRYDKMVQDQSACELSGRAKRQRGPPKDDCF